MSDAHKNFAYSTVATAPSPATSGTSLVLQLGAGANFPAVPFNATIWPTNTQPLASNAEIVRVTAIATDTLTIVRSQESSSARTVIVGDQIAAGITAKALTDIEPYVNPTGTINAYAGRVAPTNWLICDGANLSRATYANLFATIVPNVGNPTVTIATPGVFTLAAHGFQTGDTVFLTTTGALPTGLTANTIYYVIFQSSSTFNLATSYANAIAATAIATSGTQSGTHTLWACPYGLGDGSTTFGIPDLKGRVAAGNNSMGIGGVSRLTLANTGGSPGNLGGSGGEQSHQITIAELASHNHGINSVGTSGSGFTGHTFAVASSQGVQNTVGTGSDTPHNNIQPTLVVNYIIKT